jgi:hypothetical protein
MRKPNKLVHDEAARDIGRSEDVRLEWFSLVEIDLCDLSNATRVAARIIEEFLSELTKSGVVPITDEESDLVAHVVYDVRRRADELKQSWLDAHNASVAATRGKSLVSGVGNTA